MPGIRAGACGTGGIPDGFGTSEEGGTRIGAPFRNGALLLCGVVQAENEVPQPQVFCALGLLKRNPPLSSSFEKSSTMPLRKR